MQESGIENDEKTYHFLVFMATNDISKNINCIIYIYDGEDVFKIMNKKIFLMASNNKIINSRQIDFLYSQILDSENSRLCVFKSLLPNISADIFIDEQFWNNSDLNQVSNNVLITCLLKPYIRS